MRPESEREESMKKKKLRFKKRYVLGEGWPCVEELMVKIYSSWDIVSLRYRDVIWCDSPKYRLVLERVK